MEPENKEVQETTITVVAESQEKTTEALVWQKTTEAEVVVEGGNNAEETAEGKGLSKNEQKRR